jgi:hypothetical protein
MTTSPATLAGTTRFCLTCGEMEGTTWVTAKCLFEPAAPVAEYEPVVREFPHGFYAGAQKVGATRPWSLCRHEHKTRKSAETCATNLTALRNEGIGR